MLLGEWPVRDFVDPGMPLTYVTSAAARSAFGPALGTELAVVIAGFAMGAGCTALAAARLSGSALVAAALAVLGAMLNPRAFSYPKHMLFAAAALMMLSAARGPSRASVAGLAAITAVAFLFRHDHGVFIGLGAAVTVVLASSDEGARAAARRAGALVGWVAVFLAPWLLVVAWNGGVADYLGSAIAFSRAEAAHTISPGLPAFDWSALDTPANAWSWLFYLFQALPVAALVVVARRRRVTGGWRGDTAAVAAIAVMAIPANLVFMRDSLAGRVPDAFVPAALLGAFLLGPVVRGGWRPLRIAAAAMVLLVTATAVVRGADVREQLARSGVLSGPAAVRSRAADLASRLQKQLPEGDHVPSRYSRAMQPFLEYLGRCTSPGDRIMMTGLFPEVYVLAGRGFAGGHVAFLPGYYTSASDQARTVARLERQSVPFVASVKHLEPDLRADLPLVMAHVDARYHPLADIAVPETQGVRVYVESGRTATGTDAATGWPCFQ